MTDDEKDYGALNSHIEKVAKTYIEKYKMRCDLIDDYDESKFRELMKIQIELIDYDEKLNSITNKILVEAISSGVSKIERKKPKELDFNFIIKELMKRFLQIDNKNAS